jgi:hypothetical protein
MIECRSFEKELCMGLILLILVILLYGAGYGISWVGRGTLPLALFGPERFPRLMGKLAFPSLIVQALAPSAGALLIEASGSDATIAVLTLLALIIGFSVSMASSRYDQRKSLEEAEANAIGTEIMRADLLPPADAAKIQALLGGYLDQRILFYINRDDTQRMQIDKLTNQLQADLWAAVRAPAMAEPTPVAALVLAGMNDVINSQGYTQAAFWNRIPRAVWWLMAAIALCSNVIFGYRARKGKYSRLALVLPFITSTAFLLISDIDAPTRPVTISAVRTGPSSRQIETETTAPTADPINGHDWNITNRDELQSRQRWH